MTQSSRAREAPSAIGYVGLRWKEAEAEPVGQKVQKSSMTFNISTLECPACDNHGWLSTVQNPYYY